ncbi:MAG: lipopolysaccharide biosynthesis protein [Pseudomonadota bacterium]
MSGEIVRGMTRGAAWMVLFKAIDRPLGLISTLILARLLLPSDFGLVAMAMSVIAVIEMATSFSFEAALIQKQQPRREHYDTAWTLNVSVAFLCAAGTAALAPVAADYYAEPRLTEVMLVLAAGWLAWGFENVGVVDFRRQLNFRREFWFLASKRLTGFAVTIVAALLLRSYWALVVGMVTGRVAGVLISYAMHPFRPRFCLTASRELFSFSGWMLATNLLGAAVSRLPHFVLGRVYGAQILGAYTVGAEFAQIAHTELAAPVNRALFPGFSRLADRLQEFRRACVGATAVMVLIVVPASVGIAAVAEPLVRVVLGERWGAAVPVIQVLAVSSALSAIMSNNASAFLAIGRPNLITAILSIRFVVMVPMLYFAAKSTDFIAIAYAEMVSIVVSLLLSYPMLLRLLQLSAVDYAAAIWRPLGASVLMGIAVYTAIAEIGSDGSARSALIQLGAAVPLGIAVYLLVVWILWAISGRPDSAEALVAKRAWVALRAVAERGR